MKKSSLPDAEARLLKALGHPVRLQIARILQQEESCVCHLEARLRLRQAYLSQQLGVLREAGVLAERRVGTFVYYRLANSRIHDVMAAARRATGSSEAGLPPLDPAICSCPRCAERAIRKARRRPARVRRQAASGR